MSNLTFSPWDSVSPTDDFLGAGQMTDSFDGVDFVASDFDLDLDLSFLPDQTSKAQPKSDGSCIASEFDSRIPFSLDIETTPAEDLLLPLDMDELNNSFNQLNESNSGRPSLMSPVPSLVTSLEDDDHSMIESRSSFVQQEGSTQSGSENSTRTSSPEAEEISFPWSSPTQRQHFRPLPVKVASRISKRKPHREVERKYRETISDRMETLRAVIPSLLSPDSESCDSSPRISKANILDHAVLYIEELKEELASSKEAHQRLQTHYTRLRDLCGIMKERLQDVAPTKS